MNREVLQGCTILLVDDEEANLDLLEGVLNLGGYFSLVRTSDARRVVGLFEQHSPDLILLDLHMPHRTGFDVLAELRPRIPEDDYLPVLVLTADVTTEAKERALSSGARDFLTKPLDTVEVLLRVENLLEARVLHRMQREARARAEASEARASLLAEVTRTLVASLDGTTSLSHLPGLLVPDWGTGSAVLSIEGDHFIPIAAALPGATGDDDFASSLIAGLGGRLRERAMWGERSTIVVGPGNPQVTKLLAPIRVQGAAAAVLILQRPEESPFSTDERELIEEIAARAGLALENARLFAEAERATRSRDRMLSIVAHDMRSPLAAVGMYGEMLLSMLPPNGDDYSRTALTSIHQTTGRIQRLVEDLLDVSSLEQGVFSLHKAPQPLEPILREVQCMLRPLAEGRGITLKLDGEEAVCRRWINADAARLIQLLSNLVGNAIKFSPPDSGVLVTWRQAGGMIELAVIDNGPGISPEELPHIFGAFWQSRDADRRGVGLGLWIARAIAEGHGGRIWVDSVTGRGAAFRFTLPVADTEVQERMPDPIAMVPR